MDAAQAGGAAFLASFVEFVEALTVILALGAARGWRSPLLGAAGAMVVLAGLAVTIGPALQAFDTPLLRLVVGVLVLLFGLRWLRKAILRAAGRLPLHDEAAAYAETRARYAPSMPSGGVDATAFAGAFQVTMLEGGEVAFIVIALGGGRAGLAAPGCGAALALFCVIALGLMLHRPLSRIPENMLKFAVGVLLTGFGTFWSGEGIGVVWPGSDMALPAITLAWACWALLLARMAAR